MEDPYEKSLRLLAEFLSETSPEELKTLINKYDKMKIEGPTVDEYFKLSEKQYDEDSNPKKDKPFQPELYKSCIIDELIEEMKKDPWHVKFRRWINLQIWIFRCYMRYWFKLK